MAAVFVGSAMPGGVGGKTPRLRGHCAPSMLLACSSAGGGLLVGGCHASALSICMLYDSQFPTPFIFHPWPAYLKCCWCAHRVIASLLQAHRARTNFPTSWHRQRGGRVRGSVLWWGVPTIHRRSGEGDTVRLLFSLHMSIRQKCTCCGKVFFQSSGPSSWAIKICKSFFSALEL